MIPHRSIKKFLVKLNKEYIALYLYYPFPGWKWYYVNEFSSLTTSQILGLERNWPTSLLPVQTMLGLVYQHIQGHGNWILSKLETFLSHWESDEVTLLPDSLINSLQSERMKPYIKQDLIFISLNIIKWGQNFKKL